MNWWSCVVVDVLMYDALELCIGGVVYWLSCGCVDLCIGGVVYVYMCICM